MKSRVLLLVTFCALLCVTSPVLSQNGTGTITGHLTDSSGAFVAGATVSAVNLATGVRVEATSNTAGIYLLPELIPGTYTIEASKPGFKKVVRPKVTVQVADHLGIDLLLEVGAVNEAITVTAEAPQLRTEDAQTGEVINNHMVATLPQVNRDPLTLLKLSGNVQGSGDRAGWNMSAAPTGQNGAPTGGFFSGPSDTRVNGGRAASVEYLVDGVPATGGFVHQVVTATPTTEDVQEFKVLTNGISSEYGRLSGGVVEIATNAGTNALHGQLFEYHKDAFLNANNWGNDNQCSVGIKSACSKSNFRNNDFGFSVGGPVLIPHIYNGKNKTFWFASGNWIRESQSGNSSLGETISDFERNTIPDPFNGNKIVNPTPCPAGTVLPASPPNPANPANLCADLTDIGFSQNDPNFPWVQVGDVFIAPDAQGNKTPAGGDARHIPLQEVDPAIERVISLMPHANIKPLYGTVGTNYQYRTPESFKSASWSVRGDHVINERQRIFGRFTHTSQTNLTGASYPNYPSSGASVHGAFGASLHYNYAISPTLVLDLTTGGNYSPTAFGLFASGKLANVSDWGYDQDYTSTMGNAFLNINQVRTEGTAWNPAGTLIGSGNLNGPQIRSLNSTNFSYAAALTKIINRHTMKFGYDARRYYDNVNQSQGANPANPGDGYAITAAGSFLTTANDGGGPIWGSALNDANNMATFLWGLDTWSQATASTTRALAANYYAAYMQDDFKVNRKLTLNLGVRWEMQTPVTERNNNLSIWDPLGTPPFTINSGYNFTNALLASGMTAAQAEQVVIPDWAARGAFAPGAIEFVKTPQHRSRNATDYHPWNFAPRAGFAYQAMRSTVVRGSFGIFYLPIGNNLGNYGDSPGLAYANKWTNAGALQGINWRYGPGLSTITNPWPQPSWQQFVFAHDSQVANLEAAQHGSGTGGVITTSHMPREMNWSFGIQHQLPHNWLVEATYAGNHSGDLQGLYYPSHFPKSLYNAASRGLYGYDPQNNNTPYFVVASPTTGQILPGTGPTSDMQPLALLEYQYPYFGPVNVQDANIGTSNFNSLNLRVQKRLSQGLQILANYTFSKLLDNVGSENQTSDPTQTGQGSLGKTFQSVDTINNIYGLSPGDQTHRLTVFYNYQLPFGRGRHWMNSPQGVGHILEAVAGGWEISGISTWQSGTPISIGVNGTTVDNSLDINYVTASLAPGATLDSIKGAAYANARSTLCPYSCSTDKNFDPKTHPVALNKSAISNNGVAQSFTYGTLPPILKLRNPSNWNTDLSIMKSFPVLSSDGSRYFQLRLEGANIFNHPGLAGYDTDVTHATFGMITGTANTERNVQISGRFVF
ncbi:MAG TPA: carboxypeptidase regulatory-like domain-containing protein [Dongiaceae bacterium]|nr:carboxypeptidase regulatory-like domain-containing protein [Dongiaceae bacterium]